MAFQSLLADRRFDFLSRARVAEAVRRYYEGRADLADYLIGLAAAKCGAEGTHSFDRGLRSEPDFTVLG